MHWILEPAAPVVIHHLLHLSIEIAEMRYFNSYQFSLLARAALVTKGRDSQPIAITCDGLMRDTHFFGQGPIRFLSQTGDVFRRPGFDPRTAVLTRLTAGSDSVAATIHANRTRLDTHVIGVRPCYLLGSDLVVC